MDVENKLLMAAVAAINARFSSGNSVPVDRAWVTYAEWKDLQFALSLALTPPEGYVLVPVVPTSAMQDAVESMKLPHALLRTGVRLADFRERYAAMLAACPEVKP